MVWGADGQKWVDAEGLFFLLHEKRWSREARNGVFLQMICELGIIASST